VKTTPLPEVIGANARAIRTDANATLEQLSVKLRPYGLTWSTGRVGDFESGRVAATVATSIAVALGLGDLTGRPIALADLVRHDGLIELNDALTLHGENLAGFLASQPVQLQPVDLTESAKLANIDAHLKAGPTQVDTFHKLNALAGQHGRFDDVLQERAANAVGTAESRAATDLGIDVWLLAGASAILWGRTFSEERDERAGADANAQRRGQVTRQLKAELQDALKGLEHGNN
jgi:hypothetical protein